MKPCKLLQQHHALPPGEGVLNKVLYREALPGGKIPSPAMKYNSDRKGTPYLLLTKYGTTPFTYLKFRTLYPFLTADIRHFKQLGPMICTIGSALKRMHNKVNAEIKQANELFYKNKFSNSDGDPHKAWQVINELLINPAGLLVRN